MAAVFGIPAVMHSFITQNLLVILVIFFSCFCGKCIRIIIIIIEFI